ncbi:MAG: glycogen/starch synthase [Spirosomaceae bacterium]|nr:glycogen/starch synthase [Spirosomataceae bacterium]MDP5139331.1 glycogen/starch synthase [Spirosomataceae bacterium]
MDNKLRILYVTSEIDPFLELTEIAKLIKKLPQSMQERGMEVRILMPKFGTINERKNRLHEVVRLSGINITVGDEEKPLIIKVASISAAKLQVYFLDNEDYFNRKSVFSNKKGVFHEDNDERAIFFCKGVLETVKKLGWAPDIVHCTDWMTALVPLYLKTTYKNDPVFQNSKSIFTVYGNTFEHKFSDDIISKAKMLDITDEMLANLSSADFLGFMKIGVQYADLVVNANANMDADLSKMLDELAQNKIDKNIDEENITDQFFDIYNELAA